MTLYPGHLIDRIRELYAKDYVFEGEISLAEVDEVMADGLDATLAKMPEKLAWRVPEDVHDYISWFACFRQDRQENAPAGQSPLKLLQKKKAKSRVKRKQAKTSKRKNRK